MMGLQSGVYSSRAAISHRTDSALWKTLKTLLLILVFTNSAVVWSPFSLNASQISSTFTVHNYLIGGCVENS